ncbi:MAG TPA: tetratricopeptide repeat protein [Syntrophales bacterium]|nr:tetratricopeptide repeat protein [Syntrophales bacterium]HOL59262.1 tetratricopeptide repeat protein [Syntrophales bacterium]HPO35312.1 tetratricopeptide repeat protein [Syntrophales bacterium]
MKQVRLGLAVVLILSLALSSCATDRGKVRAQAEASLNVGIASIQAGDFATALKELLNAQKLSPDDPRVSYYLALAYQGKGYPEKAIEECKGAIEKKPDYSEAYNLLGTLYLNVGDFQRAISAFRKALDNVTYETPAVALYNLGQAYHRLKEYDQALTYLQEAAAKDFRGEMLPVIEYAMGEVNYERGDLKRAAQHFHQAVELAPLFADAYYRLGEAYLKQGDKARALEVWKKLLTLLPDSSAAKKAKDDMSRM